MIRWFNTLMTLRWYWYTARNRYLISVLLYAITSVGFIPAQATMLPIQDRQRVRDSLRQAKLKLFTPTERKYQGLVKIIRRMKSERASHSGNKSNLSKKYSTEFQPVDDSGRLLVCVVLSSQSRLSDTLAVIQEILRNGGVVKEITPPIGHFQIDIYCWIPYDRFDKVSALPQVSSFIEPPMVVHSD